MVRFEILSVTDVNNRTHQELMPFSCFLVSILPIEESKLLSVTIILNLCVKKNSFNLCHKTLDMLSENLWLWVIFFSLGYPGSGLQHY